MGEVHELRPGSSLPRDTRWAVVLLFEEDSLAYEPPTFGPFFSQAQAQAEADRFNARPWRDRGAREARVWPMGSLRALHEYEP